MSEVKKEDIRSYFFEETIVCAKCAEEAYPGELMRLKEDQLITSAVVKEEGGMELFCGRCEEQIK